MATARVQTHNERGRFGAYGGRYVPETLMAALEELELAYDKAKKDKKFQATACAICCEILPAVRRRCFLRDGSPRNWVARKIYLKREDLLHTGAHKINNCIGQALLAERMGKRRIIAETGAGQHGVATATVCALMGFECVVYMGTEDMRRQELNVFRMRLLGAEVRGVDSGSRTLKDAINEAMRDWVTNVRTTHYLLGSVLGAHPYPTMVRDFHRVIGREARAQILKMAGKLPTAIIACVGGGSNCHRHLLRVYQGQEGEADRRGSRRPRRTTRRSCRTFSRGQSRRAAGNLFLRSAGSRGADRADAFSFRGAGLSLDRAGACMAERSAAEPSTCRLRMPKRWKRRLFWLARKGLFLRLNQLMRSRRP